MSQLIPHTLDDVADGPEGMGVPFGPRCQPIGLDRFAFSRSGIADAKEKASAGLSRGTGEGSVTGLDTHVHSGTPLATSPLDGGQ